MRGNPSAMEAWFRHWSDAARLDVPLAQRKDLEQLLGGGRFDLTVISRRILARGSCSKCLVRVSPSLHGNGHAGSPALQLGGQFNPDGACVFRTCSGSEGWLGESGMWRETG